MSYIDRLLILMMLGLFVAPVLLERGIRHRRRQAGSVR